MRYEDGYIVTKYKNAFKKSRFLTQIIVQDF